MSEGAAVDEQVNNQNAADGDTNLADCFKVNIFQIDNYNTKPVYSHDKAYSIFRGKNVKTTSVVRIFGSTDDGVKVCLHMHHIRQAELAAMYGIAADDSGQYAITDEVIQIFVNDLEQAIRSRLAAKEEGEEQIGAAEDEDDHCIYQVESFSSRFIYGYHPDEEVFLSGVILHNLGFRCRGFINGCPALTYNCLEFILQFYIDNQIYLNTLYLKNVTFRKTEHFEEASQEANPAVALLNKEKLRSLKYPFAFNDIAPSSSCLLECDVTVDDIVRPKYVKHFPANPTHMPSLPGVIELWNDQYRRCQRNNVDYSTFIDVLRNKMTREPYTSLQNKIDSKILKAYTQKDIYASSQQLSSSLAKTASVKEPANNAVVSQNDADGDDDDEEAALEEDTLEDEVEMEEREEEEEEEEDDEEFGEMNYTLEELELYDPPSSNELARTLYSLEEPIEADGNTSTEQNVPQFDGMDDSPEISRRGEDDQSSQSSPNVLSEHFKFQNKKIRLDRDSLTSKSVKLPRLSLTKLSANTRVVMNEQLSQSTVLSSPFVSEARACLQSTPQITSNQTGGRGIRKYPLRTGARRRSSLNSTLRVTLDSIFEQEVLEVQPSIKPLIDPLKFVLSQSSSQSCTPSPPVNDISSMITLESTEHSIDCGPLLSLTSLGWNRCLEMTLMSLELHLKTRGDLTADPEVDPIQMVTFAVYNEELGDELNSSEQAAQDQEAAAQSESLHFAYIGVIAVRPEQTRAGRQEETLMVERKKVVVHYVATEADLIHQLVGFVQTFDPDVMVGYTVDTLSWGYLIQRAFALELDPLPLCRITNPYQAKGNFEGAVNKPPALVGRIIFNLWTVMKHEESMSLRQYTFEHVYHELFRERVPRYSSQHLNSLWGEGRSHLGTLNQQVLLEYYLTRVTGNIRMLAQVNVVPRTYGSQFRVESILFPLVRLENFLPIRFPKEKVSEMPSPEFIQLVLEPDSAFHAEPVAVLDFNSLYPSVMIAYNYCFSTSEDGFGCHKLKTEQATVTRLLEDIHISPSGACFVKANVRKGLVPKMLEDLLYTRVLIKNELKQVSAQLAGGQPLSSTVRRQLKRLKRQLDVCQLGLKLIANVTYGYTSANFSGRMPCVDIADSIVSKGREALEQAILFINDWGVRSGTGAKGRLREQGEIVGEITRRNPYPMGIKLEKVYQPCLLLAKKRYCGNAFESPTGKPFFDAKGIETVRRDNCKAAPKILRKCIDILFRHNADLAYVKPFLQWQIKKILNGRLSSLNDFVFAKKFWGLQFYANASVMPSCIIARQQMAVDPLGEPKQLDRVPYVIVAGSSPQDRLADLVRSPADLLSDRALTLNGPYYILRAIFPALVRVLEVLPDFDYALLMDWYNEVRHWRADKLKLDTLAEGEAGKLREHLATALCVLCHRKIADSERASTSRGVIDQQLQYPVCGRCQLAPQKAVLLLKEKVCSASRTMNQLVGTCAACTGAPMQLEVGRWPGQRHHCLTYTCSNLARVHQATRDYELLCSVDQEVSERLLRLKQSTSSSVAAVNS
ncbi:DNA polymerase zeta catalytic subunit, partial [Tyrophagus putrescentiae]